MAREELEGSCFVFPGTSIGFHYGVVLTFFWHGILCGPLHLKE